MIIAPITSLTGPIAAAAANGRIQIPKDVRS